MELPTVEPVFVKAKDIINFIQIKEIDMYESVTETIKPECVFGVQRTGMLWRIYVNILESRLALISQRITLTGQSVECYSKNPFRIGLKPDESEEDIVRVVIKGIPLSTGNYSITEFFMKNKVTLRKPIENARLRDKNNVLLNVYSGDWVAFVNKPAAPLP